MQESRLFKIIYFLLENGHATAKVLATEFEVSVRTIYRDIDALSSAGIPIYCTQGKGGGISLLDGYVFDKGILSPTEQQTIITALQSLSAITPDLEKDLIQKLNGLFKQNHPDWIQIDFSRWGNKNIDNEKFNLMKSSILQRQIITFRYVNSYGYTSHRKVKPLKICYKSNAWYLQAYCTEKNEFRTFKINRIMQIKILSEFFDETLIPPPLETTKTQDNYIPIKLKFRKEIAYRVYDEFDQSNMKELDNGEIIVTICLPDDTWLYGYLLSFGGYADILEPENVKTKFMKILQEMYLHYTNTNLSYES